MHFFYIDESGCNGRDLENEEAPIFVLGGIIVRDKGWNKTHEEIEKVISDYFGGDVPNDFELHSHELLSPGGDGPFAGHERERRCQLARDVLGILETRGHKVLVLAVDKRRLAEADVADVRNKDHVELKTPYLLCFENAISMIEWEMKENQGQSARGMVIIDEKDALKDEIETLTKHRRFNPTKSKRVKWIAEFSYPIDSKKNPMVQLSDLVCFSTKKYIEIENGYRNDYPKEAKDFYRELYAMIEPKMIRKTHVPETGRHADAYNTFVTNVTSKPRNGWKDRIYE